jgi:hypothetical protein
VKGPFVVDLRAIPSARQKPKTFAILALAWRATDYLAGEVKERNL